MLKDLYLETSLDIFCILEVYQGAVFVVLFLWNTYPNTLNKTCVLPKLVDIALKFPL